MLYLVKLRQREMRKRRRVRNEVEDGREMKEAPDARVFPQRAPVESDESDDEEEASFCSSSIWRENSGMEGNPGWREGQQIGLWHVTSLSSVATNSDP